MSLRLLTLTLLFGQLSLFAVGGANAAIPAMEHELVQAHAWIDGGLFASLIALAQAAPGPNAMVVGLAGWHVAGALGALVATLAFCGPPALVTALLGRVWGRFRAHRLSTVLVEGVAPLTVGLVLASAWSLGHAQGFRFETVAITAVAAAGALWEARVGMWMLAIGAGAAVALG